MNLPKPLSDYVIIIEYVEEKAGFIAGTYSSEKDARPMVESIWKSFEDCYRYSDGDLTSINPFQKYQSYKITGDDYFSGSDKYIYRQSMSNGFQTLSLIRCPGVFDFTDFIKHRNTISS